MLLLTDRLTDSLHIQRTLGQVAPCSAVAVGDARAQAAGHDLIICDVALDSLASIELVQAALSHHRTVASIPVLCLARDPSVLTQLQARIIAATTVISCQATPAELVDVAKRLLRGKQQANGTRKTASNVRAGVQAAGAALSEMLGAAKSRGPLPPSAVDQGGDAVLSAVGGGRLRTWLDLVRTHDDITYQHILLVAGLTAAFAIKLGLTLKMQRLVAQAALLHDIGKAHIPTDILNKPGRLSPDEMTVMRTHPSIGHQLLAQQKGLAPLFLSVVRHHHEFLDGSGYPDGLKGAQISQVVRLTTICDIYAALIERRAYKAALAPAQALVILEEMGPKLDGGLLATFSTMVGET